MRIAGFHPFSLSDFPGKVAAIVLSAQHLGEIAAALPRRSPYRIQPFRMPEGP